MYRYRVGNLKREVIICMSILPITISAIQLTCVTGHSEITKVEFNVFIFRNAPIFDLNACKNVRCATPVSTVALGNTKSRGSRSAYFRRTFFACFGTGYLECSRIFLTVNRGSKRVSYSTRRYCNGDVGFADPLTL